VTYYVLGPDGEPREATQEEWSAWSKDADWEKHHRVAEWSTEQVRVSTVFLAIDHSHGMGGPPILFETMVFLAKGVTRVGPYGDNECWRSCTRAEAQADHDRVVLMCRAFLGEFGQAVLDAAETAVRLDGEYAAVALIQAHQGTT
jgi:hypothetical protein